MEKWVEGKLGGEGGISDERVEGGVNGEGGQISKKKMKKMARALAWEEKAKEMKKEKKIKAKEKKKLARKIIEEKQSKGEPITEEEYKKAARPKRGRAYRQEVKDRLAKAPIVVLDCAFDEHHGTRELISMGRQIEHCLSASKKFPKPLKLCVTGLSPQFKECLQKRNYDKWPVEFREEADLLKNFTDCKDRLVYLTGDATATMASFDPRYDLRSNPSKIYILGGIVDHNKLKCITLNKATSLSIPTEKFPIGEYMNLKTSAILSINHSFEILLRVYNGEGWAEALKNTIPERKIEGKEKKVGGVGHEVEVSVESVEKSEDGSESSGEEEESLQEEKK